MSKKRSKKDEELLKKNLVTLLTIFKDKPNFLAKYILEYDIITDDVKRLIITNKDLIDKSKELEESDDNELHTPYFSSFKEMKDFYDKIFTTKDIPDSIIFPNNEEPSKDSLMKKLKDALKIEDYEKCAKIRDYCYKKGIELDI